MATTTRRRHRTRAQWQQLIVRAEHSPLTIEAFCRSEGITTASFYTWRKRLRSAVEVEVAEPGEVQPSFIDLGAMGAAASHPGGWDIELDLGGGAILRLRQR